MKTHVDHQAEAYVAPRRVMAETNGNAPKITNGKPKWGGAEVCPRCDKSVRTFFSELKNLTMDRKELEYLLNFCAKF